MGSPSIVTVTPAITLQQDRLKFPGMLPKEILVWKNWLRLHEAEYTTFQYNVRVGPGFDPGVNFPQYIRDGAIANSRKRIDAVVWNSNQPTIVEVKDVGDASAIGQLVSYYPLWTQDNPGTSQAKMKLVCNRTANGIELIVPHLNISLDVVPTDFSSLGLPPNGSTGVITPGGGVTIL